MDAHSKHHFVLKIDGVEYSVEHPIITGHKLLEIAGQVSGEYQIALRIPGELEQLIAPDEEFDLTSAGIEHFVSIDIRHRYSIQVDETPYRVLEQHIDGREILRIAGKDPESHFVVQRVPHAEGVVIELDQRVDLAVSGTEKFEVVHKEPLHIVIDDVRYTPPKEAMTGQELRTLPSPPVPATRDLWLDIPGKDDLKIALGEIVHLKSGMVFYTAPSTISPGEANYAFA